MKTPCRATTFISIFAIAALCLTTAMPAVASNTVSIPVLISQSCNDSNFDGVWDTMGFLNNVSMLAYNGLPSTYNWRAAMEFDVSAIPTGAVISSAILNVRYSGASGIRANTLQFNSYIGDGLITHTDFEVDNIIGPLCNAFGPQDGTSYYKVPAGDFVQSLVNGRNRYAGFMVENLYPNQTSLYGKGGGPGYAPTLDVTYSPEPATLALLALGGTIVAARRRRSAKS
jgi:hypothetical protein